MNPRQYNTETEQWEEASVPTTPGTKEGKAEGYAPAFPDNSTEASTRHSAACEALRLESEAA